MFEDEDMLPDVKGDWIRNGKGGYTLRNGVNPHGERYRLVTTFAYRLMRWAYREVAQAEAYLKGEPCNVEGDR